MLRSRRFGLAAPWPWLTTAGLTVLLLFAGFLHARAQAPADGRVEIEEVGSERVIRSNGIPAHAVGRFPNRRNPNAIEEMNYLFRMPLAPTIAEAPTPLDPYIFGVAVNGVIFDPGTAEYWNRERGSPWRYEALTGFIELGLDDSNAHVQPNGAYHYHGIPEGLVADQDPDRHSGLIGYAADGFPIYARYGFADPDDPDSDVVLVTASYRIKSEPRAGGPGGTPDGRFTIDFEYVEGLGDLDACNGRVTVTPDYPDGTYAYFLTEDFPFVPRCFAGAPDASFEKRRGGGGNRPGGPGGPRPPR